jgi:hypothetical protein
MTIEASVLLKNKQFDIQFVAGGVKFCKKQAAS